MRKSTLLKFIIALPALALALVSCTKKESPFITGVMWRPKAIQKEVKNPQTGEVRTVFVPDIIGQALSDSRIISPIITKNTSTNPVVHFTPYEGHVETDIESETEYRSSLSALNGVYYFSARNTNAQEVSIWTEWQFQADQEFKTGWGEFAEDPADKKIETFKYTNGTIELKFKTIPQQDATVSYYMIIMEAEPISPTKTRLVREWLGARSGDTDWPITPSASEGHFTHGGFNEVRFDKKKVFLAAVKDYGNSQSPMAVMLLSNPKTINIEKGVFEEDEVPAPPVVN